MVIKPEHAKRVFCTGSCMCIALYHDLLLFRQKTFYEDRIVGTYMYIVYVYAESSSRVRGEVKAALKN